MMPRISDAYEAERVFRDRERHKRQTVREVLGADANGARRRRRGRSSSPSLSDTLEHLGGCTLVDYDMMTAVQITARWPKRALHFARSAAPHIPGER